MLNTAPKALPNSYIRLGGVAYLLIIAAGALGETLVRGTLVVPGDAAATAQRIIESPQLWRAGITGDLLMHLLDIPVMFVLYTLLKPVNRGVALMALLSNVVQTAVLALNKLNLLLPLFILDKATYLNALALAERQALAYVFIRAHNYGFGIGLLFFGITCLGWGYLIRRSGYLPRVLGALMQVAGLCYLVNSFALIIAPPVADQLTPFILLPPFVAETALAIWLVVKGVAEPARQPNRSEPVSA